MAWVPFRVLIVGKTSKHRRIHAMHLVHSNRTGQAWVKPGNDGRGARQNDRTQSFRSISKW
jgi:hypothetical protein